PTTAAFTASTRHTSRGFRSLRVPSPAICFTPWPSSACSTSCELREVVRWPARTQSHRAPADPSGRLKRFLDAKLITTGPFYSWQVLIYGEDSLHYKRGSSRDGRPERRTLW